MLGSERGWCGSRALLAGILGSLVLGGCATKQPTVDPFEMADEADAGTELLDEPVVERREARRPVRNAAAFEVGESAGRPARTIEARPENWDLSDLRWFEGERFVREGMEAWQGVDDASFGVAVDADESHLYFWIEAIDETIVNSDPRNPLDGVVIWLRDPELHELLESLPATLQRRVSLTAETAIVVMPDGRVERYGSSAPLNLEAVQTATAPIRDEGYVVEVALSLEVFPFLKGMPLEDVAFRVEMLDSDDANAAAAEKMLTMLPGGEERAGRFALYTTPGLLPVRAPEQGPPRYDDLGLWQQRQNQWVYRSLEYHSPHWQVIEDLREVAEGVVDRSALPEICTAEGNAMWLVEAYEATRGGKRVALVLCGTDAGDTCPSTSRSQLVFTDIQEDAPGEWRIAEAYEVFSDELEQCPFQGPRRERTYSGFSLLPLDVVGRSVWGVGWHMELNDARDYQKESGVVLVDPQSEGFRIGNTQLVKDGASGNRRWEHDSQVYMMRLQEGDERMGVCEIERVVDMQCARFNEDCEALPRGREILTHVSEYDEERRRFTDILLRPHPRCRPSLDFDQVEGFEIFLVHDRLGLLR